MSSLSELSRFKNSTKKPDYCGIKISLRLYPVNKAPEERSTPLTLDFNNTWKLNRLLLLGKQSHLFKENHESL